MTFCFILKHKIILFYLLSFVFIRFITRYHWLSLIVIFLLLVVIRCHSLSYVITCCHVLPLLVPLVVTRCITRFHSLYPSLSLVVIRCHILYHSFSLVVTRCITRLSFYKGSRNFENCSYLSSCSLLQWRRFRKIIYSNVALNQTLLLQKYRGTFPNIFYVLEAYSTHYAKACRRINEVFH